MATHQVGRFSWRNSKALVTAAVSAGLVLTGGASAWASSTPATPTSQSVSGLASFSGTYKWYSKGDHNGGLQIGGTLYDLNKTNGRGVKFQVKVNGYSPRVYTAPTDNDYIVPQDLHYDGAVLTTQHGYWQTCQKNIITPDQCTSWIHSVNPYYS